MKWTLLSLFFVFLVSTSVLTFSAIQLCYSQNPIIQHDFIIFQNATSCYAINKTGLSEYNGEPYAVFQYTVNNGNSSFVLPDKYVITQKIELNHSDFTIKTEEAILFAEEDVTIFEIKGSGKGDDERLYRIAIDGFQFEGSAKGTGIKIEYANRVDILNVDITNFSKAIHVKDIWNCYFYHGFMIWNGYGFYAEYPESNNQFEIINFKAHSNTQYGFYFEWVSGCQISQMEALDNGKDGIYIEGGEWNEFLSTLTDMNQGSGLKLIGNHKLRGFRFNVFWAGSNQENGIYIGHSTETITFTTGMLKNNGESPIVNRGKYITITSMTLDSSSYYGIEEKANADYNIYTNNIFRNHELEAIKTEGEHNIIKHNIGIQITPEGQWYENPLVLGLIIIAIIIVGALIIVAKHTCAREW